MPKPPTFPEPLPKVRLLAVIFPHGERTWFFKLTGPTATVDKQAEAFDRFIQSIRFTDKMELPVEWTVPEGWQKDRDRPGRQATFQMGPKDESAELTVVALATKRVRSWQTSTAGAAKSACRRWPKAVWKKRPDRWK